ncbi:uncharacterized protein LOC117171437 [Belonocnema kinseyi]|uniref:uncharacterized protein LOC117171437 n=1 Tax=Belonocnema kinseyi TaxID=2817044 RepID=UPI00143DEED3|nr:uncharacterized protein LOC117171437 [Belonocnema kinseyi]XP_033214657.1 uncharacterized protein LOC117171437 [Belonocnema kinseyi]
MKLVCNSYVYILMIVLTRGIWVIQCSTDFKVDELKKLSEKLDPIECLKLLDAVYQRTSFKQKMAMAEKIHKVVRRNFGNSWVTQENCLFQLENWQKNFPGKGNIKGREVLEEALRYLGRPDLARKIVPNRREFFLDHIINPENFFENNHQDMPRRYVHKNEKEIGEISKENHSEVTDHNKIKNKKPEMNYDIYWIILIAVIALIIMSICATGIFVIYRKNCNQCINGRFCQEWDLNRDGKKFCVCCCGKRNKRNRKSYSDVDMESGCSGRCSKCWLDPQRDNYEKSRSKQETICAQKPKKLKKKRKQSRTKEKIHKKEEKRASRNKSLEKETKSQTCKWNATSEPSQTDFKERQNKKDCKCLKCPSISEDQEETRLFKKTETACNDPLCSRYIFKNITDLSLSSETECVTTGRKGKKKEKSGWSSCDSSPRLKDKERAKEPKNKEKLFQYKSGSPCSRKTYEWRKIAMEKRHGKNSV